MQKSILIILLFLLSPIATKCMDQKLLTLGTDGASSSSPVASGTVTDQQKQEEQQTRQNALNMLLIKAVEQNKVEDARAHLIAGADINTRSTLIRHGQTALIRACNGIKSRELLELLLSWPGIDVNVKDDTGYSALDDAAINTQSSLPLQMLLEYKHLVNPALDIDAIGADDKTTALYKVCSAFDVRRVALLLSHGADPNIPRKEDQQLYPLHTVCAGNGESEFAIMLLLLENNADTECVCPYGETYISGTARSGAITGLSRRGQTPLSLALNRLVAHRDIHCNRIALLLAYGADCRNYGYLDIIMSMHPEADELHPDAHVAGPITYKDCPQNMCKWLAKDLTPSQASWHRLIFQEAVLAANGITFDPTLCTATDFNCLDALGLSPLMWAAARGHYFLVEALLQIPGINTNLCDPRTGNTALHFASRNGHFDCVALLLSYPTTRMRFNKSKRSPRDLACSRLATIIKEQAKASSANDDSATKLIKMQNLGLAMSNLQNVLCMFELLNADRSFVMRDLGNVSPYLAPELCKHIALYITLFDINRQGSDSSEGAAASAAASSAAADAAAADARLEQ